MKGTAVRLLEMILVLGLFSIIYIIINPVVNQIYQTAYQIGTQLKMNEQYFTAIDIMYNLWKFSPYVFFFGYSIYGIISSIRWEREIYDLG